LIDWVVDQTRRLLKIAGQLLKMEPCSDPMTIGGGVKMLRNQYLAGLKEECAESRPKIPRLDVNAEYTIDGNVDDIAKASPELAICLYNEVKVCSCGKPCAYTLTHCNSCGKSLEDVEIGKSDNVFTSFLFGVRKATKGFPLTISLRRETDDCLIFDDMLQLTPLHLNGIPKKHYIPDWRFLLTDPEKGLQLLNTMEDELWTASLPFLESEAFKKSQYRTDVPLEEIRSKIIRCFNYPPSQYQMHIQWLVPPLCPFQHYMAECKNHFHHGRGFPTSYVRKLLELNEPYPVTKTTDIRQIIDHYKTKVCYDTEWAEWYEKICVQSTLEFQNWQADDFQYVVQNDEVFLFTVEDGHVKLGDKVWEKSPASLWNKDKNLLQMYGRPYNEQGKASGTYIPNALTTDFGPTGISLWPGVKPDA